MKLGQVWWGHAVEALVGQNIGPIPARTFRPVLDLNAKRPKYGTTKQILQTITQPLRYTCDMVCGDVRTVPIHFQAAGRTRIPNLALILCVYYGSPME